MRLLYFGRAICRIVSFACIVAGLHAIFGDFDAIWLAILVAILIMSELLGTMAQHRIDTLTRLCIQDTLQYALQREMSRITPHGADTQKTSALRLPAFKPPQQYRPRDTKQTFHGIEYPEYR